MRIVIDLTEDDTALSPGDGTLPDKTVICDDDDIVVSMRDTSIRMTHAQFENLLSQMNQWWNAIPGDE